jgi:alpha-1,2-mannosyltransferase
MSQTTSDTLPLTGPRGLLPALRSMHPARRWAWTLWLIVFLVVSGIIITGNRKTVTPAYRGAAMKWLRSKPLYDDDGRGFLYLPAAALAFAPCAALPHELGEIAWRVLTIGSYAWALSRACRLLQQQTGRELFLVATLVTLPLCWSSARNGQSTLPMAALMLLGAVAAAESRWWRSAILLALGLALKPLAIVMLLLMGGVHGPLRWRLPIAVAGTLAAPFLFQSPAYVWQAYLDCWQMFHAATEFGLEPIWAQPFAALEVWGLATPRFVQTILRVLAAGLTLGLAIYAHRMWPTPRAALFTFTLAACYLMLFNPRTENNTYSCLAPAIGIALAMSWRLPGQTLLTVAYALLALGVVGGWSLGKVVAPGITPIWLAPLCASIFTVLIVRQILRGPRAEFGNAAAGQPTEEIAPRRLAA